MAEARRPSDRLTSIEVELRGMHTAMGELVRLGERQSNLLDLFTRLEATSTKRYEDHEARIRAIELAQPQLKETRKWVISAASAVVAAVGTVLISLALKGHATTLPAPKDPLPAIAPRAADEPKVRPAPLTN